MLNKVRADLKVDLPDELIDALLDSYEEMKNHYFIGNHEPAELKGGKFVEACVRIIQYKKDKNYTPLGDKFEPVVNWLVDIEQTPKNALIDSYRLHIPRVLRGMYHIRNSRGVGHLGDDINPNHSDASVLMSSANWVLAELFRIHYQCSLEEAQTIVDALAQQELALVYQSENVKRVLLTSLTQKDQTLLLLASEYPNTVTDTDLIEWIEPGNSSSYRSNVLKRLHDERRIEYQNNSCLILPPGQLYVQNNYQLWLDELNKEK